MKSPIHEMSMAPFASRAGIALATSAAAMSIICALFVPYAYPWPSLAWAVLACASAVWVARLATGAMSVGDVIGALESESSRASVAPGCGPGAKKAIS